MDTTQGQGQQPNNLPSSDVSTVSEQAPSTPAVEEILELDSRSKFKFQGEEWTPESLQQAILRQKDYTQKTQSLSKEGEYYKNLYTDLKAVERDPRLANKFKELYPEQFHEYLEDVLGVSEGDFESQGNDPKQIEQLIQKTIQSKYGEKFQTMDQIQRELHEKKVEAESAKIDAWESKFMSKYEDADPEEVWARASNLYEEHKMNLNDALVERLFKESHEKFAARADARNKKRTQQAIEKGSKAQDMGRGGSVGGSAPRKPRTLEEATDLALAEAYKG